jgi:hypothetical protein
MAHFARIENGIVREVIVVNNDILLDLEGVEQESIGVKFCSNLFGGEWVQTSYNHKFRARYAAGGMKFDKENDIFIEPEPISADEN